MEKLVQDLKKGFLQMIEAVKGDTTAKGSENMDGPKLESTEKVTVQGDRAIQLKAARGPARPSVSKGPPVQTQSKDQ